MNLSDLQRNDDGIVDAVADVLPDDPVARRLRELGFVSGEPVKVVALAPAGGDPMLVQVGFTRFALRRAEAARVRLRSGGAHA